MKKNIIKLNESQLRKIVAESVKKVLKEGYDYNGWNKRIENKRKMILVQNKSIKQLR